MNSLELMKSPEVRKAGDRSNYYNIFFFADYIHTDIQSASVTVNYKFLETIYRILSQLVVIISNSHLNAKQLQQV